MRKHPLLALTITFAASAALVPSTILESAAAGAVPDGRQSVSGATFTSSAPQTTPATLASTATSGRSAAARAARRARARRGAREHASRSSASFGVAGLVRPVTSLAGADVVLSELPRVPRRFLSSARSPSPRATGGLPAAAGGVWHALRLCESGGNYGENPGDGSYGAYQLAATTGGSSGFSGLPNQAPPAVQDAAAIRLQARVGWSAWPQCASALSL